jgi:hypothetical protein
VESTRRTGIKKTISIDATSESQVLANKALEIFWIFLSTAMHSPKTTQKRVQQRYKP